MRKSHEDKYEIFPINLCGFHWLQLSKTNSKSVQICRSADRVLSEELARVFPSATIIKVAPDSIIKYNEGRTTVFKCTVEGFARTVPREIVSETLNVLFMISTFALNMEFPIQTTRNVYLEILKLGFNQIVTLNHKDMLSALEQEDLQFQIRKILDPSWKG